MDRVIVYQSELEVLSSAVMERPDIETGGELFGFWTSKGEPVVLYAIGPNFREDCGRKDFCGDPIIDG